VGPIVAGAFFYLDDGMPVHSDRHVGAGIQKFRSPFTETAAWQATRDHKFDANAALANMDAAVRLCSIYPGEHPVIPHPKSPQKPFSFRFDDISLKNIMVCYSIVCSISVAELVDSQI
jgi:hypothetical protein